MSKSASSKSVVSGPQASTEQTCEDVAALHRRARQFTEVAFALAALAALVFATVLNQTGVGAFLTDEARRVVTWSFVGLATLDTALLLVWPWLMHKISGIPSN